MGNLLGKITNFIKDPHFPLFLLPTIKNISPSIARVLKYGKYNPNTESYWNKKYQSGKYESVEDERYGPLRREVIKLVPPRSMVLDVGCGTGKFMEILRDEKLCSSTGIDISEVSIRMIKKNGFQGFKCKLPNLPSSLKYNSFDICTIIETLEHISYPHKTIKEVYKIIKKNGYIIVSVPDNSMTPEEYDEHVSSFNVCSISDLLSKYFRVDTCFSFESSGHKYIIVKAKKFNNDIPCS